MSDHEAVAANAKETVLKLAARILAGETPSADEMREAVALMRGNRTVQAAASASGATRGKKAAPKNLDALLGQFGL
jgi:hypothetical protein